MDERRADPRETILERVFPDLRYGGDPDVERYFELRSQGRMLDALSVYNARLRPRYPDDARRVELLRLYRMRSPAYGRFLHDLLMERADDMIARIKRNIDAMTAPLAGLSLKDTYVVLKAVESVARLLPEDTDAAKGFAEAYEDYASILSYREREMSRAAYLLSEFYKQTLVEDDEAPDFVASSLKAEEERRRSEREREERNFFDLSRIEFDAADVARIEIPAGLDRDEDRTLAYCHKYWNRVDDPAFERIVWLYSRKYGTRHYDVFRTVKTGRRRKYADDEILSRVATTIADRYSYTVQGDLYMQAAWRRIKAGLYGGQAAGGSARAWTGSPGPVAAQTGRDRQAAVRTETGPDAAAGHPVSPAQATEARDGLAAPPARDGAARGKLMPAGAQARPLGPGRPAAPRDIPEIKATGSISDRIKSLSGRAYDVYRDLFLARVRTHIRDALLKGRGKGAPVFGESLNAAEDLVFEFMERNYANSYMDWTSSQYRERMRGLGFELDGLDSIIDSCYGKISA